MSLPMRSQWVRRERLRAVNRIRAYSMGLGAKEVFHSSLLWSHLRLVKYAYAEANIELSYVKRLNQGYGYIIK